MNKKVAIIADWLTNQGGAEKVISQILDIFDNPTIFTSIYNEKKLPEFNKYKIHTSFIDKLPFAKTKHQLYLPLMPYAFESFDLSDFDIVISSSFALAKNIITKPETKHICYCHNTMRYIWDESHTYIKNHSFNKIIKLISKPYLHNIRNTDLLSNQRVDKFIANSGFVQKRIKKYYNKEAIIIYPSHAIENTANIQPNKQNYYLATGRLKEFKRFDLIIKAFNKTKENLIIAGEGEDEERLKKLNTNLNTKFIGFVSNKKLQTLYENAKGFIFPQCEDFGITPIEAQYFGCPVLAYSKGGALETIVNQKTGLFFHKQTVKELIVGLNSFSKINWDYNFIHKHSQKFSNQNLQKKIKNVIIQQFITKTDNGRRN